MKRVITHNSGNGPKFTANRLPVTLVYIEKFESKKMALLRETQIKKWSHSKKKALIEQDSAKLHLLAKIRTSNKADRI